MLADYKLYLRYVRAFGQTFSEKELSLKTWEVAKVLMRRALASEGPVVTIELIRQHMKNGWAASPYTA